MAAKIQTQLTGAFTFLKRHMPTIEQRLVELYNEQWRPPRKRRLTAAAVGETLALAEITVGSGGYRFRFEPADLFGGYAPFVSVGGEQIGTIAVESPIVNGRQILPFPGVEKMFAYSITTENKPASPKRLRATARPVKPNWLKPLSYRSEYDAWLGRIKLRQGAVAVSVDEPKHSKRIAHVQRRLSRIIGLLAPVIGEASQQVAKLYNDSRCEGREVTAAQVKRRIELVEINLRPEGWWSLSFGDDDLFAGHTIEVRVSRNNAISVDLLG